ncbi:helix-turn-helix domain-containing protein [Paractinoplanes globisporus]|uniref:TetR family transcriptional regulator n=1 Tax=Paractinoplanes globisporus TaxID=113565 RepID=A0ABW6WLS5_9ACTN|nr:helix-turn-helix domain-containing protein [Actinoplanes globisporus]
MADTRARILAVALELFSARGYAGTSVADLAKRLGITKAALYYHFSAKSDILEALASGPLEALEALVASAPARSRVELLGEISDITADIYTVSRLIGDDPSARAALRAPRMQDVNAALTTALAGARSADGAAAGGGSTDGAAAGGGSADGAAAGGEIAGGAMVRAHAAYAAIKNGTLAVMAATGARPTPAERSELIAAALRALG